MKVVIPQISWHGKEPIMSIDFDPSSKGEDGSYRLATGGGDCQLNIWLLSALDTFTPDLTCVAELKRHEKTVNVVRFSPDGSCIATGGDDAYVILWKRGGGTVTIPSFLAGGDGDDHAAGEEEGNKEDWTCDKVLRKHVNDVADLSWSADSNYLLSGSIDNSAVLWDIKKGIATHVWSEKDHSGFVHGVAYDPQSEFAATMCIDRTLRFFDIKNKKVAHKALKYPDEWLSHDVKAEEEDDAEKGKENLPKSEDVNKEEHETGSDVPLKKKRGTVVNRLFHDEFLSTYCRRLAFSPKGELLMVPGGLLPPTPSHSQTPEIEVVELEDGDATVKSPKDDEKKAGIKKKDKKKEPATNNAVILFCRNSWTTPVAIIPTRESFSIATRFSPVYYTRQRQPFDYDSFIPPKKSERSFASIAKLSPPKEEKHPLIKMPYRLMYAVATNDSVLIGDTATHRPLAVVRSIHLATISDISWAANGQVLIVSSTDGYCSIISFEKGELGQEFVVQESEEFPKLAKDAFPILPPEPKPIAKKKTPKAKRSPHPDNEANKMDAGKTPKSSKGKKKQSIVEHQKNALFTKLAASPTPVCKKEETPAPSCDVTLQSEKSVKHDVPLSSEQKVLKPMPAEDSTSSFGVAASPTEEKPKSPAVTPKVTKTPKTTLLNFFKRTPKSTQVGANETPKVKPQTVKPAAEPELIVLDDSQGETPTHTDDKTDVCQASSSTSLKTAVLVLTRIDDNASNVPVPTSSPLRNKRLSSSPHALTSELDKMPSAELKIQKMEDMNLIMQSSNSASLDGEAMDVEESDNNINDNGSSDLIMKKEAEVATTINSDEHKLSEEQKGKDASEKAPLPSIAGTVLSQSPVASTSGQPKPPRRITLTTLCSSPKSSS